MSIEVGATNKKGILAELMRLKRILEKIKHKLRKEHIVVLHWTATSRDYTHYESVNRYHKRIGYSKSSLGEYCAYNILITGDGEAHMARTYDEDGKAVHALKEFHTDLCLTLSPEDKKPSTEQIEALEEILNEVKEHFAGKKIILKPHNFYTPTLCPGDWLRNWIKEYT